MDADLKKRIDDMVKSEKVFLFMKGTPSFPQCGFSARAVAILRELETNFGSFNVLEDESIRHGIKEYGNWPTIPQLYVNGELLGGSDIMLEMFETGELKDSLNS
ncbi:MAG: Grx4 family monothiol glutaredoxin [Pseudobdellovibrionaceae bacterium]|nr:Grx4 family monothiol glutaredoxin [Bdellovibrionales bacterium]USN46201.1 MAG: Grx4 family monothiol glutaredoxin [Pseudobdellovibrionaceae bacterium]